MKTLFFITAILGMLSMSLSSLAQTENRNKVVVIPLSSTEVSKATPETIVSASGQWTSAGISGFPSMIIKDMFFYVQSDTNPPCEFTMNYVINNIQSRAFRRFFLSVGGSTQVSFGAGVNSSDLRFGTIGGGTCVRNWAAFGVAAP